MPNVLEKSYVSEFHPNSSKTSLPTLKKYLDNLSRSSNEKIVNCIVACRLDFKFPSYLVETDFIPEIGFKSVGDLSSLKGL